MVERNSFNGLQELVKDEVQEPVDPREPPRIDLALRYEDMAKPLYAAEGEDDHAGDLERLTGKAIRKLEEILDQPTDFDSVQAVRVQVSAIQTTLATQLKVDEGRLKRRKVDILPKLIEMMNAEEQRMAQRHIVLEATLEN